jgi:hypothetical protein
VGLFGESIFILGRLLENILSEYIFIIKKLGKLHLTKKQILNLDFHQKIELLHSKKIKTLSGSQFSKLMSVKWDRNIYGHQLHSKNKDYQAVLMIALDSVVFFDKKITKLKQKPKK